MENIEATSEVGTGSSIHPTSVAPQHRGTLRTVMIRLLQACLRRVQRPRSTAAVALLPAPAGWSPTTAQVENDTVTIPTSGVWQLLGVILMIVLAGTAAWLAWQRIETIEQQHEEQVSMTLAAVKHELEQQQMSLNTIHDHVHRLTAQVSAASSPASTDLPLELSALKQHVEEMELTIGAYGALLGKQQHTLATHTEQLTAHDDTLRSLTISPRLASTTTSVKARKRAVRSTPPTLATEMETGATPTARPAITLPANLGAWSLGVRNPVP